MQQWYCFLFSFFTCLHSSSHVYLIQMLMISLGDLTAEIKMTNSWSNNAMFEVIIHNSNPSVVYSDVWVKIDYMFSYSNVYGMTRTDSAVGMFPLPHTPWLLKTIEMIRIPCYNPISIKNYNTKTKELIHSAFAFILILIFILFFLFKKRREKKKRKCINFSFQPEDTGPCSRPSAPFTSPAQTPKVSNWLVELSTPKSSECTARSPPFSKWSLNMLLYLECIYLYIV